MAFLPVRFFSRALNVNTQVHVVLPDPQPDAAPPRILYLLHGYSDDHSTWMRQTSVERYASLYNLAVVMPGVNHSFYTDEKYGENYWTFVCDELPQVLRQYFRLSDGPALAAGNSMGGYGAMKLALTYPERFTAAGCFSGAVDIHDDMARNIGDLQLNAPRIFGGTEIPECSDLFHLMQKPAASRPRIYAACGDQDFLFSQHNRFVSALKDCGWDVTHREIPGMNHSWNCWDGVLRDFLAWALR